MTTVRMAKATPTILTMATTHMNASTLTLILALLNKY